MGISNDDNVRYELTVYINAHTINATVLESNTTNLSVMREARKVFKAEKTKET
jgi:hypothetical protein